MKKSLFTLFIITFILVFVWALSAETPAMDDTVNLTQSNSDAVADAVVRLQQTELTRVSRGRLKPNPVLFPLHTVYQNILQNHDLLLHQLTNQYSNSLITIGNVFTDYKSVATSGSGPDDTRYFRQRLVEIYDLKPEADESETLLELWLHIQNSEMNLQALPLRASLLLNSRKWIIAYYKDDRVPAEIEARLTELREREDKINNPFELEAYIKGLSTEYAELLASIVEGKKQGDEAPPSLEVEEKIQGK